MRRLAEAWPDAEKVQTLSAQIGWSHHQVLPDAWADQPELYLWYAAKPLRAGGPSDSCRGKSP